MPANGPPSSEPIRLPAGPIRGAWTALALLLAINLFNYIDRQILSAVLPKLEATFTPNDPGAGAKMGLLTTAFLVAYMVLSPVFGWLGDRFHRWSLVGIGIILWSLASGGSGLAPAGAYLILLATRCLVGVGEAAYGPVAPSLISDMFSVRHRGLVLAVFYAAIPVGSALGFVLGGLVADSPLTWRGAFLLVVPPGVLLGLLCFLMPEPIRGGADNAAGSDASLAEKLRVLLRTPSYLFNTAGMTAMTFVLGGVAAWMPSYIFDREARFVLDEPALKRFAATDPAPPAEVVARLGSVTDADVVLVQADLRRLVNGVLSRDEQGLYLSHIIDSSLTSESPSLGGISTRFGAIVVIGGLFATLLGGVAGDALRERYGGSYFLVAGFGMLTSYPLFLSVLFVPFPTAWVFMFLAVFFLFFNTGPTNTALANVTHPSIRATAFAINIFIIHALGDAISPPIIGWLRDAFSFQTAMVTVSLFIPVSAALWLAGSPFLKRDTEMAVHR